MRGPEEAMNAEDTTRSSSGEGSEGNEERDPCSSPPCKRLKQAVLNFQSNSSTSNGSPSTPPPLNLSSGKEVIVIDDDSRSSRCGGLVTAAPSPPEKGPLKQSSDKDQKDEKQPNISNFTVPIDKPSDSPKSDDQEINCSPKQTSPNDAKTPLKPTSAEKKKLKEEKQKQKEEKERQRQEAKAQKEKEKLEAKQKKEQERLEKQAEKEKKGKERQEKKQREEREKQEKKEKKEEERRKKEEEVNAKLEEKRKKEEGKKQQEEELKRKKMQASLSFKSFFTKTTNAPPKTLPKASLKFEPFEIKPHMSLAPVVRVQPSKDSQQQLDNLMQEQNNVTLYLEGLQKRKPLPPYRKERRRTIAVKPIIQEEPTEKSKKKDDSIELSDDETSDSESVVEIQQEEKKRMKVIFLKFHENNRPPYYGTQQKKSKKISPRNPLNKDEGLLNYEVDSDDEWEEEEPGESLSDCDSGDDDEGDEGEEEDDGFMVPHGYLSDDEGIDADDEENQVDPNSREELQLAKVKAWEAELKRKCKAKKPVCIGCVWPDNKNINEMLQQFEACILVDEPTIAIQTTSSSTSKDSYLQPMSDNIAATPDIYKSGMYVPEEAMPDLITLIHRSTAGVSKLMEYFKQHWSKKCENTKAHPTLAGKGHISKRQLEAKIKYIATKERRNDKPRWYVHDKILEAYGLLTTIGHGQGVPHSGTSCSPQLFSTNAGIQVFTKSVSPSENKGQSSVMKMMTSPQLQTDNSGTQDNQKSTSASLQSTMLQAQNKQLSAPVVKRRIVLQPIPIPEVGAGMTKENLQSSSAGKNLQTQNDKQNITKRRVVLQPVITKTEERPGITEAKTPNVQSSSGDKSLQTQNDKQNITKRRLVLQPVTTKTGEPGNTEAELPNLQKSSAVQSLQTQNDKQRVVLQPVAITEGGPGITETKIPNVQSSSGDKSLQTQNDKRRVVLQPVAITGGGPGITKTNLPNLQSSSAGQTLQVKRRVVLQPVAKPDAGGVSAKENHPDQQGISTKEIIQVQNDKQLLVTSVAKQVVTLQPVSHPETAKDNQSNPPLSEVKQSSDNIEKTPAMSTTLTRNPEQDISNTNPPKGVTESSLTSTVSTSNSLSTPSTDKAVIPNKAGCVSSAVKRTAPSPVGAARAAKVPRKSEESVQIHYDVNTSTTEATPNVPDMVSCPQSKPPLDISQQESPEESNRKSISETAELENSNSSKEIPECDLVKNACKTDGVQPMEIEQIIKA